MSYRDFCLELSRLAEEGCPNGGWGAKEGEGEIMTKSKEELAEKWVSDLEEGHRIKQHILDDRVQYHPGLRLRMIDGFLAGYEAGRLEGMQWMLKQLSKQTATECQHINNYIDKNYDSY